MSVNAIDKNSKTAEQICKDGNNSQGVEILQKFVKSSQAANESSQKENEQELKNKQKGAQKKFKQTHLCFWFCKQNEIQENLELRDRL